MSTQKIQDVVNKFVADVTELAKDAARDALSNALSLTVRPRMPSVQDLVKDAYDEIDAEKTAKPKKRKKWTLKKIEAEGHAKMGARTKRKTKKQLARRDANRAWRIRQQMESKRSAGDKKWLANYTKKHSK